MTATSRLTNDVRVTVAKVTTEGQGQTDDKTAATVIAGAPPTIGDRAIVARTNHASLTIFIHTGLIGEEPMLRETSAQALVYQVLDDVLSGASIPATARGIMFSVVDALRSSCARVEDLRRAEKISIEMHKLEWALRRSDSRGVMAAREGLKSLAAEMLNSSILGA